MFKNITYGIIVIVIGFNVGYGQASDDLKAETYYLNGQDSTFQSLPETRQVVDSLLNSSWDSRNDDTSKSLSDARLGFRLSERLDYKAGIARGHYLLGVTYQRVGDHEIALKHFLTALDMEKERDDQVQVGKILNGIAIIYLRQENYEASADYFQRSIDLMKKIENKKREGIATGNLGYLHFEQEQYTRALLYYNRALKLLEGTEDSRLGYFIYKLNIGDTYVQLGEFEKAEGILMQALDYFNREGLARTQSEVYLSFSKLYYKSGTNQSMALEYAQKSLKKAQSINFKESIIAAHKQMASIYESRNAYREALNHYKSYKAVQDSLRNSERSQRLNEMQTRFDVEQKDRKIELLNKESALKEAELGRQKLWRMFMIIGIALMGVIVGLLYRYNNQKKRANHLLEHKNREIEQQNGALVHLNEEKNEFLGMAAHDLRNPLSGITSVVSLIESEDSISETEMEEYIGLIGTSADRMLSLINNLLDVNAIEEGGRELELSEVDVLAVLDLTISGEQKHAVEKSIKLQKDIAPNIPRVLADEEALQRVLENLISNAVKYSPEESAVYISAQGLNEQLQILVKDNGPGIPESEQDQLFKRFSRISTTPTADESSTGLGLFIVKKLVEKMDGNVQCNSVVGKGTEFIVTLPAAVPDIAHVDESTVS